MCGRGEGSSLNSLVALSVPPSKRLELDEISGILQFKAFILGKGIEPGGEVI